MLHVEGVRAMTNRERHLTIGSRRIGETTHEEVVSMIVGARRDALSEA